MLLLRKIAQQRQLSPPTLLTFDQVETVFRTLSYFDGVNFAARAKAKALFSVGLMDDICPPSTVYAAYNHYSGDKEIAVYNYNNHEGGGPFQLRKQAQFLRDLWL